MFRPNIGGKYGSPYGNPCGIAAGKKIIGSILVFLFKYPKDDANKAQTEQAENDPVECCHLEKV